MKAVASSETFTVPWKSTRGYSPKHNINLHSHENCKFQVNKDAILGCLLSLIISDSFYVIKMRICINYGYKQITR